ncbi:hypothetical protein llap_22659 [Limosa lapponica baueri]|uniref:Uncharacterized protein n=1 Tax=Limosa lapponica baueri TaxID=1758121 RepID=A0A2I0SZR1_LIMLA|nr:hypothetical protein llap_22659 [Limosa lapponica baueri]
MILINLVAIPTVTQVAVTVLGTIPVTTLVAMTTRLTTDHPHSGHDGSRPHDHASGHRTTRLTMPMVATTEAGPMTTLVATEPHG